ncbi:hypothetical protein D3C79_649980 [compost metagenome]
MAAADGHAEHQCRAAGAGEIIGIGDLAVAQVDSQARQPVSGIDQHGFVQVHGEIQGLTGDIGTAGRNLHRRHRGGYPIDAIDTALQATAEVVAGEVDDSGAAVFEIKAQRTDPGEAVDQYGVGAAVELGHAGDMPVGRAAEHQFEVGVVDAADAFIEGHGVTDRTAGDGADVDPHDIGHLRRHGIHPHRRGAAQVVERKIQAVARPVAHGPAVQVQGARHANAVGVVIARLHGVLEQQRASGGA